MKLQNAQEHGSRKMVYMFEELIVLQAMYILVMIGFHIMLAVVFVFGMMTVLI